LTHDADDVLMIGSLLFSINALKRTSKSCMDTKDMRVVLEIHWIDHADDDDRV
jgi:hypothetical protein